MKKHIQFYIFINFVYNFISSFRCQSVVAVLVFVAVSILHRESFSSEKQREKKIYKKLLNLYTSVLKLPYFSVASSLSYRVAIFVSIKRWAEENIIKIKVFWKLRNEKNEQNSIKNVLVLA